MTAANSFSLVRILLCSSALAMGLSACSEPEVILPGKREAIRPDSEIETVNQSAAISLPEQVANANWSQSHGNPSYRTAHPALSTSPSLAWSVPIGAGDGRKQRINTRPVVADGRIYTLDSAARVSAVPPSGQLLWNSDLVPSRDEEGQATGGGRQPRRRGPVHRSWAWPCWAESRLHWAC